MPSEHPHVAGARCRLGRFLRDLLFSDRGILGCIVGRKERPELVVGETHHVEVEAVLLERYEFRAEHLLIPPRVQREFVVGDDEGPPLRRRQMRQDNDRDFLKAQFPGSQKARVPGDDHAFAIYQDGIRPPELPDAGRNLRDLLVRVRPGVTGARQESAYRPKFDLRGDIHH